MQPDESFSREVGTLYSVEDKECMAALAGAAQWIEHRPENQRLKGRLFHGLGARSPVGGMREVADQCFSPLLYTSLPLSKNK